MKIKTKHIICGIKCLFLGLVMALPFIAVLPTALYYGFNQYATEQPLIKNQYETHNVEYLNELKPGIYKLKESITDFDLENINFLSGKIILPFQESQLTLTIMEFKDPDITPDTNYFLGNNYNITFAEQYLNIYLTDILDINFDDIDIDGQIIGTYKAYLLIDEYNIEEANFNGQVKNTFLLESDYLGNQIIEDYINNQNALEIAFDNIFNSNGFSWVKNSIIATPVYAFVGAFGLTNELFLSNLIVYWTNILLIYAILNIVIVCFTKLTTLGQKKDKD